MQTRFNLNDKVKIVFRDETVYGVVTEINDTEFHVMNGNIDLGWYPNDVSNYVSKEVE